MVRASSLRIIIVCLLSFLSCLAPSIAQEPTEEQKREWQKLYPKLNSKMARMEELLNYADRFLGDEDFKLNVLLGLTEFIFLTQQSQSSLPSYLLEGDKKVYLSALKKTEALGHDLYEAVKLSDIDKAREIFSKLDKVRRKSHAKWAE